MPGGSEVIRLIDDQLLWALRRPFSRESVKHDDAERIVTRDRNCALEAATWDRSPRIASLVSLPALDHVLGGLPAQSMFHAGGNEAISAHPMVEIFELRNSLEDHAQTLWSRARIVVL
jgi:hypothetical protein